MCFLGYACVWRTDVITVKNIAIPSRPLRGRRGRIKVLGVQAATDSYIYTFRGFSISRFVECTRPGLTPPRGTANNVRRICICQKLRRRSVRARLLSPASKIAVWRDANSADSDDAAELRLRMEHVTYPRVDRFSGTACG